MNQFKLLLISTTAALALTACGGSDPVVVPAGAGAAGAGGAGAGGAGPTVGAVTGAISSIVGDYKVVVSKVDCLASDSNAFVKIEPQANGSCKVTSTAVGTVVEFRRDILPVGAYTLRVASDGSLEMLQGTASKAKVACPANGLCSVNATPGFTTYSIAGGSATATGAAVGLSQLIITGSGTAKTVLSGVFYGLGGNVAYPGASPVFAGESGVLSFAAP